MKTTAEQMMDTPIYGISEAAQYLRVPLTTLTYWVKGGRSPLINLASADPSRLSFNNLLECHVLSSLRSIYNLRIPKVRGALAELTRHVRHRHPLIDQVFMTDRRDLFIEHLGEIIALAPGGQTQIRETVGYYMERVEQDPNGLFKLYPFVMGRTPHEPKLILINPSVGFGKPVIAGTGISTAVVASRFNARESIDDLASEYSVKPQQIEEAIRWEQRTAAIAA
jgi:uncharacterized protein (DUF433 family)